MKKAASYRVCRNRENRLRLEAVVLYGIGAFPFGAGQRNRVCAIRHMPQ